MESKRACFFGKRLFKETRLPQSLRWHELGASDNSYGSQKCDGSRWRRQSLRTMDRDLSSSSFPHTSSLFYDIGRLHAFTIVHFYLGLESRLLRRVTGLRFFRIKRKQILDGRPHIQTHVQVGAEVRSDAYPFFAVDGGHHGSWSQYEKGVRLDFLLSLNGRFVSRSRRCA